MKEAVAILGINSFSGSTFTEFLLKRDIPIVGFARSTNLDEIFLPYRMKLDPGASKVEVFESNLISDHEFIAETILNRGIRYVFNFAAQSMVAESWNTPEDLSLIHI